MLGELCPVCKRITGHGMGKRPVEVRMEDGTWESGEMQQDCLTVYGHAALITWNGVTGWFYQHLGRGRPNEWRYATVALHDQPPTADEPRTQRREPSP